ncbi:MAG: type II secretion system protein M [Alteromonadaceae bacterium]|nr:type II secretion system protein M [Alteromonadaceae bacterium]
MTTFLAPHIQKGQQKWQQLNGREKILVSVMSLVVVIFLLYSLIWQPLNTQLVKSTKKLTRQQQLLTWVEKNTARYQQFNKNGKVSRGSLTGIVNQSARQKNITVTRMQPQGDDIQVWIDEVPFELLLQWLEQLVSVNGLQIQAIDLSATDDQGMVRVRRLQLGRS